MNRLLLNNISVVGVGWGAYWMGAGGPGYVRRQWDALLPLLESGAIDPPIGGVRPCADGRGPDRYRGTARYRQTDPQPERARPQRAPRLGSAQRAGGRPARAHAGAAALRPAQPGEVRTHDGDGQGARGDQDGLHASCAGAPTAHPAIDVPREIPTRIPVTPTAILR